MFIPMNFAVGVIMGAVATYIYKDDSAKKALNDTSSKVKGLFKKKPEAIESAEHAVAEVADEAKADMTAAKTEAAEVAGEIKSESVDIVKDTKASAQA